MNFKRYLELRERALEELVQGEQTDREPDMQSFAFLGDAVYSMYIRRHLLATGIFKTRILHDLAAKLISAKLQALVLNRLETNLTAEEKDFCRRARNTQVTAPPSATATEYRTSTAWEALLGYYEWHGNQLRQEQLLQQSLKIAVEALRDEINK